MWDVLLRREGGNFEQRQRWTNMFIRLFEIKFEIFSVPWQHLLIQLSLTLDSLQLWYRVWLFSGIISNSTVFEINAKGFQKPISSKVSSLVVILNVSKDIKKLLFIELEQVWTKCRRYRWIFSQFNSNNDSKRQKKRESELNQQD